MDFEELDVYRVIDGRRWRFWAYPHADYTKVFAIGMDIMRGENEPAGYHVNVALDGTVDTGDREVPESMFPYLREVANESRTPERVAHNIKVLDNSD